MDADEPRKFRKPAGQYLGPPDMGEGGWGEGGWAREILCGEGVGEGDKRRFSLEKRSERPWPPWGRGEYPNRQSSRAAALNQKL